jgi:hypothetical protein
VLGTVDLLLRMKADPAGLPNLSDQVGHMVRTNSESILGVAVVSDRDEDLSHGVAIGSHRPHGRAVAPGAGALPGAGSGQRVEGDARAARAGRDAAGAAARQRRGW